MQDILLGKRIGYIEDNIDNYVNIDTLSDWEKAENIMSKQI